MARHHIVAGVADSFHRREGSICDSLNVSAGLDCAFGFCKNPREFFVRNFTKDGLCSRPFGHASRKQD
jgi:hypothetical protein